MALAQVQRQEVQPLSPRSTNIQYKARPQKQRQMKEQIEETEDDEAKRAEAARKAAKEKEYAPPPPDWIIQPPLSKGGLIEKYRTGSLLGKGGFALAYAGDLRSKNSPLHRQVFALKVVRSRMTQKKMEEKFRTELQIHAKMSHPNIVEFHRAFTYEDSTYVVLELCSNGSVMDMVKKRRCLTLPEVRRLTVQLCGAIKYMHARNVIHRDLKMGNLFLDSGMNLKIGDFGLAAVLVSRDEYEGMFDYAKSRRTTLCGTPNYIAPEILEKGKGGHDHKVDIWAIGVILFAMIAGQPPFQSSSQHEIYKRARNVDYAWPEESKQLNDVPDEAKDLVARLLKVDAERRPDPDQIVGHTFFSMHGGDAIPAIMDPSFRTESPHYLDRKARPHGDVMLKGTERLSLRTLAQQCGVGCLPGDIAPQPAVGADMDLSLYKECAAEEAAGLGPVVPLPDDVVYSSKYSLRTWLPQQPARQRTEVEPSTRKQIDAASESMARLKVASVCEAPSAAIERPRRAPVPSHAATLRAAQVRKPSTSKVTARSVAIDGEEAALKANTIGSGRARRGFLNELPSRPLSNPVQKENQAPDILKQRSKTARSKKVIVIDDEEPELQTAKPARPMTKDDYIDATSPEPDKKRREIAAKTRARIASNVQKELSTDSDNKETFRSPPIAVEVEKKGMARAPPTRRPKPKSHQTVLLDPSEPTEEVPVSKPDDVLQSLEELHDSLQSSLKSNELHKFPLNVKEIETRSKAFKQRPVVVKWVDYTNKFGIGYVLADGTVGCTFKGDEKISPTCVTVAGVENHFKNRHMPSYKERHQVVPSNSCRIEFIEDTGSDGFKRITCPPSQFRIPISPAGEPGRLDPGTSTYDSEKRRKLSLWDKFGRYMTQTLGKSDDEDITEPSIPPARKRSNTSNPATPFIKFYQRLGNVGIWGFSDTSFQINFPDHTKLLLSPFTNNQIWTDFYHLPVSAASKLQRGQKIAPEDLGERGILCYPLDVMLSGRFERRDFLEILRANQFERKIEFVRDLVGTWVKEGGLGIMGDRKAVRWEGNSDGEGKAVWVSVGARGGDERYERVG